MNKTQLIHTGKRMEKKGLVEGASGNISIRDGNDIIITKSGTVLDDLNEGLFVTMNLDEGGGDDLNEVSSDYNVHKAIYRATDLKAVVHCHGVFNVVISLVEDMIKPPDFEGGIFLGNIPVLDGDLKEQERAELISRSVKKNNVAVLRGHGIYSAGHTLLEALTRAEYVEHSCEILYRLCLLDK
ncbi:MAG: class II aldolase/adducin family protein [Archaeoglobaceae archaeon]